MYFIYTLRGPKLILLDITHLCTGVVRIIKHTIITVYVLLVYLRQICVHTIMLNVFTLISTQVIVHSALFNEYFSSVWCHDCLQLLQILRDAIFLDVILKHSILVLHHRYFLCCDDYS